MLLADIYNLNVAGINENVFIVSIIRADDIVRRRGYSDHNVTMYVCTYVCGYVGV